MYSLYKGKIAQNKGKLKGNEGKQGKGMGTHPSLRNDGVRCSSHLSGTKLFNGLVDIARRRHIQLCITCASQCTENCAEAGGVATMGRSAPRPAPDAPSDARCHRFRGNFVVFISSVLKPTVISAPGRAFGLPEPPPPYLSAPKTRPARLPAGCLPI